MLAERAARRRGEWYARFAVRTPCDLADGGLHAVTVVVDADHKVLRIEVPCHRSPGAEAASRLGATSCLATKAEILRALGTGNRYATLDIPGQDVLQEAVNRCIGKSSERRAHRQAQKTPRPEWGYDLEDKDAGWKYFAHYSCRVRNYLVRTGLITEGVSVGVRRSHDDKGMVLILNSDIAATRFQGVWQRSNLAEKLSIGSLGSRCQVCPKHQNKDFDRLRVHLKGAEHAKNLGRHVDKIARALSALGGRQ
jgi:hypothetical protein